VVRLFKSQIRDCPRNCKRRATIETTDRKIGKAMAGVRAASQETCRGKDNQHRTRGSGREMTMTQAKLSHANPMRPPMRARCILPFIPHFFDEDRT
jgi:hypothetical protein